MRKDKIIDFIYDEEEWIDYMIDGNLSSLDLFYYLIFHSPMLYSFKAYILGKENIAEYDKLYFEHNQKYITDTVKKIILEF